MTVEQTSINAFIRIKDTLGPLQQDVYHYIQSHPFSCNKDIATGLGKPINVITPRAKELEEAELVTKGGKKRDKTTGMSVNFWDVVT
jgi:hypothetical protein